MSKSNNSIRNIYIKCTKTIYNKNAKNSYHKSNESKEENIIKKNNLLEENYSKDKFTPTNKSKHIKYYQKNNNDDTYLNRNDKKKVLNENMDLIIDNLRKDESNVMTIHNINLINSMNNITFYDSIPNMKKKLLKNQINKYNSQTFNNHNDISIKNNSSMDFHLHHQKQRGNITVNKKRVSIENKNKSNNKEGELRANSNNYSNYSLSKKKNPFKELNYKKLNLSENYEKNVIKFNKGNYNSYLNKAENKNNKNLYSSTEYINTRELFTREFSYSKNTNDNINKRLSNDNSTKKNDLSFFNICSANTNLIGEEDCNGNKNKKFFEKFSNRNVINVNKLESFKMNDNTKISINNINSKNIENNSNFKHYSNSSSNIFSLLSNKSINSNKSKLDKENLNKIKKNIIKEKIHKIKSKDYFNSIAKTEANIIQRHSSKTKSEENKFLENNGKKENKSLKNKVKKSKIFQNSLNENNLFNINNTKKNGLGEMYLNENYNCGNITCTSNHSGKFYFSTYNIDNSNKNIIKNQITEKQIFQNKISNNTNNKEIPQLIRKNNSKKNYEKENKYNTNILEKIEVNKASFPKITLSKIKNKSQNKKYSESFKETRNESENLYAKKTQQESWINSSEQTNSFSKNIDNYCHLSNYKEKKDEKRIREQEYLKKRSAPKKTVSNIIYNKKQLPNQMKKEKQNLEDKSLEENISSPDWKKGKLDFSKDKTCFLYDITDISKIRNDNYEEDESNNNYNYSNENLDNISEKKNSTVLNNINYLLKSPSSTVYKKPAINFINNSLIANGKDSFNNRILLGSSQLNENDNYLQNSKKKNRKIYLTFKSKNLMESKESFNDSNNKRIKKNKININLNSINYDEPDLLPKIKENLLIQSINSYKKIKNNLSKNNNNISKDIANSEFSSVAHINTKMAVTNGFINKYFCYYINYNPKTNCFLSKVRIDKSKLILYEIPKKKVCYFSKKRKILAKKLPKSEICYLKKDLFVNKIIKIININNDFNNDENINIKNEINLNKKENEDNIIKNNSHQYSFTSINSNDYGNNYFEISFGKKANKSLFNLSNEINRNNLNYNNDINVNKFISSEIKNEEENKKKNIYNNENKFLNNIINISPSKKCLNNRNSFPINNNKTNVINLKKTERGLQLLEKIAGNRISPFPNKNKNFFLNININNKEDIKINNKYKEKNNNINKIDINKKRSYNSIACIKNDFIEFLNIIAINNYDFILNKISYLMLNNNIVTIDNISQLVINQNILIEIILNKAMKEKKYIKIYSKLCKDLFISLMSIIDNYNDDLEIFDKITKDKNFKAILKNKILEKINHFNFFSFKNSEKFNKNITEKEPLAYETKLKFTYLVYFIGELLENKLLSQKSGFEILDILYKKYQNYNNNSSNGIYCKDLYLEGIEILLTKMKRIIYEKNNLEHIQRYNIFIKNYLNNIFKNRAKKNDLPKYLYYKIFNIIQSQKDEEEVKKKEKIKTYVKCKNILPEINEISGEYKNEFMKVNNNNDNKNNSFTILEEKYNDIIINNKNKSDLLLKKKSIIRTNMIEIIKKDIEKFIIEPNINKIKYDLFKELNNRYNEELNIKKSIEIWEIFYYYIEACIDLINDEEKIYRANEYIENIVNIFTINLPNESWEMLHYKLISLYLNINEICIDNIYMHQIMGFLLFILIKNKNFFIKDLNNFLNKENEIIINIAKVVKYSIIFADKDAKKYHNDFKQTKLFIGNNNFYNIVTKPLEKKFL